MPEEAHSPPSARSSTLLFPSPRAEASTTAESSEFLLHQLRTNSFRVSGGGSGCRSSSSASSVARNKSGRPAASYEIAAHPPPRVVSASDDAVIVDSLTAAAINLQQPHRQPSSSSDGCVSDPDEEEELEVKAISSPPSPVLVAAAAATASGGPAAAVASDGEDRDSPRRPQQQHHRRTPALAWERLAQSLRQSDTKPYLASFLNAWAGSLETHNVVERLLEEARKTGQYVRFRPSMEVAISSCAEAETVDAVSVLHSVLSLRDAFVPNWPERDSIAVFPRLEDEGTTQPLFAPERVKPFAACDAVAHWEAGVLTIYSNDFPAAGGAVAPPETPSHEGRQLLNWDSPVPTVTKFLSALRLVMAAVQHPACKTFSYRRLEFLRSTFHTHKMFNAAAELAETKANKHRDFYNVRKVDTHVHHSACMHQKHLLRFIRKKYKTEPEEVVARSTEGVPVTLAEMFEREVGVAARDASLDLLNVHALGSCFQRFDLFNSKYNPFGQALLREVFLKTDNIMGGRYLAELTQEVASDLQDSKYQFVEWRMSIYGRRRDEWHRLAAWIKRHNLASQQVRWMVQIPRLFHVYRRLNLVKSFGELLRNIFEPLFEAIRDPEAHPDIFSLLLQLNGWDSVDDESVVSKYTSEGGALPLPNEWTEPANPPYSYWAYYMYANIRSLNHLLIARGLRHLPFRPHCGEAGSVSHLASAFLVADAINHGIMLKKAPVLLYLFYLRQIGLAMSPLSNNALFHDISKNPFAQFFSVGLNVSLSTDDPMMFHFTSEPLLEEYSCCAHTWKLSPVDLCELARNSVLQSHFEPQFKRHWISSDYTKRGAAGNDILKTNVSSIRVQFREDALSEELKYLRDVLRFQDIITQLNNQV